MIKTKLKVCMIGATGVGKTSLVTRYVRGTFSGEYLTTIGVKIEAKRIPRPGGGVVDLMLWDLSGEDEFQRVQPAYLRGSAGYLLVVDGTRRETIDTAAALEARVRSVVPRAPFFVLLNKADLVASWELGPDDLAGMRERGWRCLRTSAKTGEGIDRALDLLVDAILAPGVREARDGR
jgi:small GTP-binding protein